MTIVPECWCRYPIVFYFHKKEDKRLLDSFNFYIRQMKESGLVEKWKSDELNKVARRNPAKRNVGKASFELGRQPLCLRDLTVAFVVLGAGMALAALASALESLSEICIARKKYAGAANT